jgi:hypothetical protein
MTWGRRQNPKQQHPNEVANIAQVLSCTRTFTYGDMQTKGPIIKNNIKAFTSCNAYVDSEATSFVMPAYVFVFEVIWGLWGEMESTPH